MNQKMKILMIIYLFNFTKYIPNILSQTWIINQFSYPEIWDKNNQFWVYQQGYINWDYKIYSSFKWFCSTFQNFLLFIYNCLVIFVFLYYFGLTQENKKTRKNEILAGARSHRDDEFCGSSSFWIHDGADFEPFLCFMILPPKWESQFLN